MQLGTLEFYTEKVQQAVDNYESITAQLAAGDVTNAKDPFGALLCDPEPEHGGGPAAFDTACRSTITNYATLYSNLLQTHGAILARLKHMHAALTGTLQVYSDLEGKNTGRFDRIFDGLPETEGHDGAS